MVEEGLGPERLVVERYVPWLVRDVLALRFCSVDCL